MERKNVLYVALCFSTIAFAIAFVYPAVTTQRVLWYHPLSGDWSFEIKPSDLAMDFYGRTFQAVIAALVVGALANFVAKRFKSLSSNFAGVLVAWAIAMTMLAMAEYAWTMYFRVPKPATLPADYQAR
ncbi:MAG: hypothetical protein QM831_22060 [Kofleriaceae bacterium]